MTELNADEKSVLRLLPSVDDLLNTDAAVRVGEESGAKRLTQLARGVIEAVRAELRGSSPNGGREYSREMLLAELQQRLADEWTAKKRTRLQRVINATGVIVHTNLGRSALSANAVRALAETASGYCTLEFDIDSGKRGPRGKYAEQLLAELTGAEAAVIVNNCAAAAFLVLTVFASGREVIVSRGELVEIGGDFRVPDVLSQSGATMREVGTTNKTRLSDYRSAISDNTAMILRVHPSNYKIIGFTATPSLAELAEEAHENELILFEDAGSGALNSLAGFGLADEPIIGDSIAGGADIVSFSGDKLLGGSQAGLIVGKRDLIERVRRHPLYRALRVDKLSYAVIQATLDSCARGKAIEEVPTLRMIGMSAEELSARAAEFVGKIGKENFSAELIPGNSVIGGGAAPSVRLETTLIALTHKNATADEFGRMLRSADPPVVARIEDDKVLIDLRTVSREEEGELAGVLTGLD
jgi:L-seryl-tRNA(Ser) seleniumtransferase